MDSMNLPQRAVLLVRISDDRDGEAAGVARQEADGRALASRLGWTVAEVVIENDVSAFKRRRIRLPNGNVELRTIRPGFRDALDKLMTGLRDGLLAYDLDRVVRDPRDLEDLIDVVEHKGIPVETVTGSLRLSNDTEIMAARIGVAFANKSSRDTSRRVTRKHLELAEQGKTNGGGYRGYGYTYQKEVIEEEAAVIRDIAQAILGGQSLNSIAADLNEKNAPTATGARWTGRSVKSVVSKPSVAGLRSYKGKVIGSAAWPPILERDTWEEVNSTLANRRGRSDNTLKRWLNGVLHCANCGKELKGWQGNAGPRYWCATPLGGCGKITINAVPAEAEVERRILQLLTRKDVLTRLRTIADGDDDGGARRQLAKDEAKLRQLAEMWGNDELSLAEYRAARAPIDQRVRESRALVHAAAPRALRGLLAGDVRAAWADLTPAGRREVARTLWPGGLDVRPHPKDRPRRFDPDRIVRRDMM
ncbi:recombinase family protein [Streptomyces sp. S1A]|uniref:recombinase family protein n=1 Tax=Streptomyces sp. ICN903 TaxID=2964654 RepID=UPI001EDB188C|nr:recombinase family protein [Streptomyces sp. ICN903]MCG3042559.1 recombinase family protein [Streptomyces sp. ICN903]